MDEVDLIFLGINDIGERIYEWLQSRDDASVIALLTHKDQLNLVEDVEPDLLISAGFRHIIPESILDIPRLGAVNVHKSYLPYNRGANPNVWSIVEDNPAGVSVHYMTAAVDAGPIIDRRQVPVWPDDSGRDLYDRLEIEQMKQFKAVWPDIRDGTAETIHQESAEGTHHYKGDFVDLWEIDRNETVVTGDFLDRLRALTFPPFRNAYFEKDGDRYYVNVSITTEERSDNSDTKRVPRYPEDDEELP